MLNICICKINKKNFPLYGKRREFQKYVSYNLKRVVKKCMIIVKSDMICFLRLEKKFYRKEKTATFGNSTLLLNFERHNSCNVLKISLVNRQKDL